MQDLMPPINTPDKLFHDGDPSQGIEGTIVSAEFMNNEQGAIRDLQQELISILTAANMEPDSGKNDQIITALRTLFLEASAGSVFPVGVPVPWPLATPPDGWLKCNGAKFDKEQYPKLAVAYPAGVLPDLRGEFLRGWDDGRGVDTSRELLSNQQDAIRNITGSIGWSGGRLFSLADGAFKPINGAGASEVATTDEQGGEFTLAHANFDASLVVPTAEENRPRNVAFNYIVRAA